MKRRKYLKAAIILTALSILLIAPPLAVDMSYNYDYYFPEAKIINSSILSTVPSVPNIKVTIGPITYQKVKKNTPVVRREIKPQADAEPKKWVCKAPRPLIQGSGTVRECEWE